MAAAMVGQREGLASPLSPFLDDEFLVRSVQALSLGHHDSSSQRGNRNLTESSRGRAEDDDDDFIVRSVEALSFGNHESSSRSGNARPTKPSAAREEDDDREGFGLLEYGCSHYRRRCRIRAPCCNEIYSCRHCHNEAKSKERNLRGKCADLPIHGVETVICSVCSTEQKVQRICESCGVCMGEYFCAKCRFFDDDTSKMQYHCDDCGICRTGGREKFFHCKKCGCCLTVSLQNGHTCVEKSMHHDCPICMEYLFDSRGRIEVLRCGHTIHLTCLQEMQKRSQYSCPICSKSTCDLSQYWLLLDREVAATPMPEGYRNKMVWILCNDCGVTGQATFHIIGHKCANCRSYNTRQTTGRSSSI